MKPIATKSEAAQAQLDYLFDWSKWLVSGDTIGSFVVTITGPDSALDNYLNVLASPATAVRVWLRSGTVGATYNIKCAIVTVSTPPRHDERILALTLT